jgi:hypothetical protein
MLYILRAIFSGEVIIIMLLQLPAGTYASSDEQIQLLDSSDTACSPVYQLDGRYALLNLISSGLMSSHYLYCVM